MASVIKLKRSMTPGAVPSNLNEGEIAANLEDKKLYIGGKNGGANVHLVSGDYYNLISRANTAFATNGADIILTVDNDVLSNDAISFIGDDILTVTRVANGSITLTIDNDVIQTLGSDSGTATGSTHNINIVGTSKEIETSASGAQVQIGLPDDVSITSDLTVGGGVFTTGNTEVGGVTTLTGAVTISNTVSILGDTTFAEDITVSGNTSITDKLSVTGNTALTGTLTVTGLTTLNGGLTMDSGKFSVADTSGNVDAQGTLNVDGSSTFNAISTTTIQANGIVDFDNTTQSTSTSTGALVVDGGVGIAKNLNVGGDARITGDIIVDGDMSVEGAVTYISSSTVNVDDSMLKLSANNSADTVDTGVYGKYVTGGSTIRYAGYFRDATNDTFAFYANTTVEPTTTVDVAAANYRLAQVDAIIDGGTY